MKMQGVTQNDFTHAVNTVSARYDYNLAVHPDTHESGVRRITTTGRLWVLDSHASGARTSWNGRHTKAACWHAFRDVIREIFRSNPQAVITTSLARYTAQNFEDTYPRTGTQNIGSEFAPACMPELCTGPCAGTYR